VAQVVSNRSAEVDEGAPSSVFEGGDFSSTSFASHRSPAGGCTIGQASVLRNYVGMAY
jgi:hypothetical protein